MPLDLAGSSFSTSGSRGVGNLASDTDQPIALSPLLDRHASDADTTARPATKGPSPRANTGLGDPSDGVRILNPISPVERTELYRYEVPSRLDVLQAWEGAVKEVDLENGQFTARLYDLTNSNAEESEAVFDLADVSVNDKELLRIGGIFRWMIGYRRYSYGQQERVSAIVFRRLPAWYESDIEDAIGYGEALARSISIDDGVQTTPEP